MKYQYKLKDSDLPINKDDLNYKINITNGNFYDKVFRNLSLYQSNVENSDFSKSTHVLTTFIQVDFTNVLFKEIKTGGFRANFIKFEYVDFSNSNLKNANFDFSNFRDCNFSDCNLENSTFTGSSFKNVIFLNSNLKYSVFTSIEWDAGFLGVSFDNADLRNSNLVKKCNYQDLRPRYADISNAILDKESLEILIANAKLVMKNTRWTMYDEKVGKNIDIPYPGTAELLEINNYQIKLDEILSIKNITENNDITVIGSIDYNETTLNNQNYE